MSPQVAPPSSTGPTEPPRGFWDRVRHATPVVLTVLATIFAGMSSSEMTRAQYYRALAAQHQSKVSDQWGFFQAKRIRGTTYDSTVTLLHALGEPEDVRAESLQATARQLPEALGRIAAEAERLLNAVHAARAELGASAAPLTQAAEALKKAASERATRATELRSRVDQMLTGTGASAVRYLDGRSLPLPEGESANPIETLRADAAAVRADLPALLDQVEARQLDGAQTAALQRFTEEEIRQAIQAAEARAASYEKLCEPVTRAIDELGALIAAEQSLVRDLRRATNDLRFALGALPGDTGKAVTDVRLAGAALLQREGDLRERAERSATSYRAAQVGYTSRRYGREAAYNRFIAALYELQVRKAGLESDRHRQRSMHLFFAMLAAQAGVTIATFSLAVRHRSLMWALATLAGLTALAIGAFGFLDEIHHALARVQP